MRCKTERSQAGTAGRDGNPPLRPPRPTGRTKHWPTSRAHRTDRTAVNTGGVNAGIEPPVIRRVSRQARLIAFCKVERHGHDDTHFRSLGPTPFRGWSPVLASNRGLVPLLLIASAQDGDPPPPRRFRHLTSANSRESEIAAGPNIGVERRDARMHPLRFGHSGCAAPQMPAAAAVILTIWRACWLPEGIVTLNSRVQHGAEGSPGTGHASRWAHVSWRQISKASDRIARWAWATR